MLEIVKAKLLSFDFRFLEKLTNHWQLLSNVIRANSLKLHNNLLNLIPLYVCKILELIGIIAKSNNHFINRNIVENFRANDSRKINGFTGS